MSFNDFYEKYISYGPYQESLPKNIYEGMYQYPHFITLTINLLIMFFVLKSTKGKSKKEIMHKLKIVASVMLLLEVFRMLWMPLFILLNRKETFSFFMPAAFYGGIGISLYPLWIFYDYGGLHLMSIQSMISHGLMLLSSILMLRCYEIKDLKKSTVISFIGFLIMVLVALITGISRGQNYMALLDNSGLPLVGLIKAPYHNFLMIPIELFGFWLLLFVFKKMQKKYLAGD